MLKSLNSVGNCGVSEASLASAFSCDIKITSIAPKGYKVMGGEEQSNKKLSFLGVTEHKNSKLVDVIKENIKNSDGVIVINKTDSMTESEKFINGIVMESIGTKPLLEMELTDLDLEEDVLSFIFTNKMKTLYVEGCQSQECFEKIRRYFNKIFKALQYQCSFASNKY